MKYLTKAVVKSNLSAVDLAEAICNIMIEHYGKHNYKDFVNVINNRLNIVMSKKVKIELDEYSYNCSDGCCTDYGTTTTVNGKKLDLHNQDVATILQQVLTELGYKAEIIETYNS
jgi:hypothetical protein